MQQSNNNYHTASLQIHEHIETLVRQLKPLLGLIHKAVRTQFISLQQGLPAHVHPNFPQENSALTKKTQEAYNAWKAGMPGLFDNSRDEFCLQTACMHFVRIFFLRACQDNGLPLDTTSPATAESASRHEQCPAALSLNVKEQYLQTLTALYRQASLDLFTSHQLFDWFTPDASITTKLFNLLHRYELKGLSLDILGRVYNESFIEPKQRSEKGQFYTPPHIVNYMLDTLGFPGYSDDDYKKQHDFVEKTMGDLSCGSGSFLVAAAARKRALLQRMLANNEMSREQALQFLTSTLLGFDLNPFACYLARLNLLIQCLPFLLDEHGRPCRSVDNFRIYCADILEPAVEEQVGLALHSLDYLIGNPPYVSASESSRNLAYRDKVWNSGIYQLLHQKWDLFVPFFERNLQFLRPGSGKLALIVSNGIETEGYAERLRQALCSHYRLLQIDFFPGLHLFPGAAVENTIVFAEHHPPDEQHQVIRRQHLQADCQHFETLPAVSQPSSHGQVFRWRYTPALDRHLLDGSIPLCALVYIGTGIEAQSDEHCDPVIEGKRQKRFTLNNVFLPAFPGDARPTGYTGDGVLGDDIDYYCLRRKRYVAYEQYRAHMRGPRHSALFHTPEKLLLGETSGGYYDRDGLIANHSVQVVVPWKALEQAGVLPERGIQRVYRKSQQISGLTCDLARLAELFDLRYLLAILNSQLLRRYISANLHEGTRKNRVYPNVWKRLPIKIASIERQQEIGRLVEEVQEAYRHSSGLESQHRINLLLEQIEIAIEAIYGG